MQGRRDLEFKFKSTGACFYAEKAVETRWFGILLCGWRMFIAVFIMENDELAKYDVKWLSNNRQWAEFLLSSLNTHGQITNPSPILPFCSSSWLIYQPTEWASLTITTGRNLRISFNFQFIHHTTEQVIRSLKIYPKLYNPVFRTQLSRYLCNC